MQSRFQDSVDPLYFQFKEQILTRIANGAYRPGQKLPSQNEFHAETGLSVGTIRRALYELSQQGLLYGMRGKGVFVAQSAQHSPDINTRILGFVYSFEQTHGPYLSKLLEAVTQHCNLLGYELKIYNNRSAGISQLLKEAVRKRLVAGFLLGSASYTELADIIQQAGIPFVWVNNLPNDSAQNCVLPNVQQFIRRGVDYFFTLGHHKIGLLTGPESIWANARITGAFIAALKERGLSHCAEWMRSGEWGEETGYRLMKTIISLKERPTAIIAAEDLIAVGAINAVREEGLEVPRDFSILSNGNITPVFLHPVPLTVTDMHLEEIGYRSVEMMRDILENHRLPERVEVDADIIIRQSTAPLEEEVRVLGGG